MTASNNTKQNMKTNEADDRDLHAFSQSVLA